MSHCTYIIIYYIPGQCTVSSLISYWKNWIIHQQFYISNNWKNSHRPVSVSVHFNQASPHSLHTSSAGHLRTHSFHSQIHDLVGSCLSAGYIGPGDGMNISERQFYLGWMAGKKWKWSHSVVSDSVRPHGLQPTRLLHPWDSPGKNTGVACHFLLQGIFPAQGSNSGLPHCGQTFTLWTIGESQDGWLAIP